MVNLICGWCRHRFYKIIKKDRFDEYPILTCPKCARVLPSSKKVKINSTGKTHIHEDYKDEDIAG